MKTFWLSFCDSDLPTGEQFLGACLVDVTPEDANEMRVELAVRFPNAAEGAEWIAAASRKAHQMKCNPGGEMMSIDVTYAPSDNLALYPRNVLMSKSELEAIAPVELMSGKQ